MINAQSLVITQEYLKIISEIDEFKGSWQALNRLTPERLTSLKKVASIESIGSSTRIEGSKLSDSEVEKLLSRLETQSFTSRDEQEVAGYAFVCEEVFSSFDGMLFSENLIKQLHSWLLKYSNKDERHRGDYKKLANHVEAFDAQGKSVGVVFETATPFETPMKMQELVQWVQKAIAEKQMHPLMIIGVFIVVFLSIHPFQDGNGRLSRILTTMLLLQTGYVYVPYSSLESVIETNKEKYYLALRKTQQSLKTDQQEWNPWILFFLQSLLKQKQNLEKKMGREALLSAHLPELSAKILELIQSHGRLGMSDLEMLTQTNRSTLKKHLGDLIRSKLLNRHGKGPATRYSVV